MRDGFHGRRDGLRRLRRAAIKACVACLTATLCLALVGVGRSYGKGPSESQVKAAFLLNFAKFVEWPSGSFSDSSSPIVIGVIGDGESADEIDRAVRGKTIEGRRLTARRLGGGDDLSGCHILFISAAEKRRVARILDRSKDLPAVTVGETDGFVEVGGVIGFVVEDNRVGFEINVAAARRKHVKISSQLLRLARNVKE